MAPVGKKLTPGKSLLGRLRANKWEGFCQGKEIQLKILILGGLGRAAQTLDQRERPPVAGRLIHSTFTLCISFAHYS